MTDLTLGIVLKADSSGLVGEVRVGAKEIDALGRTARKSGESASQGSRGYSRFSRAATQSRAAAVRLRGELGKLRRGFLNLRNVVIGGILFTAGREIAKTAVEFDSLDKAMASSTESAAAAKREMAFVERTSERLGLRLREVAKDYIKLIAAARDTVIEGEQTREIFLGIVEAGAAMQLSAADISGTLRAVQQIMSKGNVQAEELRGQLGERLPGAFNLAADAMGVTTAELNKMLDRGEVLATDLLPRLAFLLREKFGKAAENAAKGARAALARFNNAFDKLQLDIASSGFLDTLIDGANALRDAFSDPAFRAGVRDITSGLIELIRFAVENNKALTVLATTIIGLRLGVGVGGGKGAVAGAGLGALGGLALLLRDGDSGRPSVTVPLGPDGGSTGFRPPLRPPSIRRKFKPGIKADEQRGQLQRLLAARQASEDAFDTLSLLQEAERRALKAGVDTLTPKGQAFEETIRDILRLQAAIAEAGETNTRQADTVADIQEKLLGLKSPYEQAVAAADAWRDQALAGLDSTKAGYDEFAADVETIFNQQLVEAQEENLRASRAWSDGAIRALKDYADAASDAAAQVERALTNAFVGAEDALVEFVKTGKLDFASLADSMITDLIRIQVQSQITGPLAEFLGGALKGVFGGAGAGTGGFTSPGEVQVLHGGGIAGGASARRAVDPRAFDNAPRFHSGGIAGGEVPIIAKRREGIFTPEQMAALAPAGAGVKVEIIDQRGSNAPAPQVSRERGPDGLETVRVFIADEVNKQVRQGGFDGAFEDSFGIRRAGSQR